MHTASAAARADWIMRGVELRAIGPRVGGHAPGHPVRISALTESTPPGRCVEGFEIDVCGFRVGGLFFFFDVL